MKVYLINLDRHPDRLAHMRAQLGAIPFERIAAVDGSAVLSGGGPLTRFERACLESHRIAWRAFLDGADTHACFLEDDLHIRPDLAALVETGAWAPDDAHAVKLDTYLQAIDLGARIPCAIAGRELARLYSRHQSSAAYVLSRQGAARYLELTETPVRPADYALFPNRPRRMGLTIYQLIPAVAIQDHLLPPGEGGRAFATAMAATDGAAASRPISLIGKLRREAARLEDQTASLVERTYLRTRLGVETTTVVIE